MLSLNLPRCSKLSVHFCFILEHELFSSWSAQVSNLTAAFATLNTAYQVQQQKLNMIVAARFAASNSTLRCERATMTVASSQLCTLKILSATGLPVTVASSKISVSSSSGMLHCLPIAWPQLLIFVVAGSISIGGLWTANSGASYSFRIAMASLPLADSVDIKLSASIVRPDGAVATVPSLAVHPNANGVQTLSSLLFSERMSWMGLNNILFFFCWQACWCVEATASLAQFSTVGA